MACVCVCFCVCVFVCALPPCICCVSIQACCIILWSVCESDTLCWLGSVVIGSLFNWRPASISPQGPASEKQLCSSPWFFSFFKSSVNQYFYQPSVTGLYAVKAAVFSFNEPTGNYHQLCRTPHPVAQCFTTWYLAAVSVLVWMKCFNKRCKYRILKQSGIIADLICRARDWFSARCVDICTYGRANQVGEWMLSDYIALWPAGVCWHVHLNNLLDSS